MRSQEHFADPRISTLRESLRAIFGRKMRFEHIFKAKVAKPEFTKCDLFILFE